ncbi:MAG: HD domain-containing protein [Planctomycetia bacterium]|nr:HD domain-containing protein [Planctomycetia bacterium]
MSIWKTESLIHDPVHGYIPFTSRASCENGGSEEISEEDLIDDPWIQRLRQIHQLQTAWWVFPTAEHSRFPHVIGSMHLASRVTDRLYESLKEVCDARATTDRERTPGRGYVESLMRLAALLHDVGHGPFGHFFDDHYLAEYNLTHESLGAKIIEGELGEKIRRIRRTPNGQLEPGETLDPEQVAYLIRRPSPDDRDRPSVPRWLRMLRSLFCGLYTVDNMDFVLRDAYMSGFANHAFDIDRLLRYTRFTPRGLTIHRHGFSTLIRFLIVRSELFRTIYFHRGVRAIDLELETIFREGRELLFEGNPAADDESLRRYRDFTEWSLQVDLTRWSRIPDSPSLPEPDQRRRRLGLYWRRLASHQYRWKMVYERSVFFTPQQPESVSIFADRDAFELLVRRNLPESLREVELRIDLVRHNHRPETVDQNFLYDPAIDQVVTLDSQELLRQLPVTWKICRIYAEDLSLMKEISQTVDRLLGQGSPDDVTNM